ncbi:MAG TPA: Na+/H+ antiporter NhaA, partial [Acidimicrobiia bacterium]|nr:Na+/H+ antiporter NhaA [Acidimicrobiia bacterium]
MDRRHQTWATSERFVPQRFVRPFVRFTQIEAASGIVLLAATIVALIWANSRWSATYFDILETHLVIEFGPFHFDETVLHLINDGLMAIFFFVVGLEIKRELVLGDLRDRRKATLPVVAALGGMVLPALLYILITFDPGGEALRGWGIPMATDIAFAVGVVALLGPRVPTGAKLFLLTLAIADDIGAITVIAIFYTEDVSLTYLALAVGGLALVRVATTVGIRSLAFYVPIGVLIWFLTLESGVHATLAGVALGFLTPARPMYPAAEFDRRARAILDSFPEEP